MQKIFILSYLSIAALFISCSNYVEVEQPNTRSPKYTSDFQYLINNKNLFEPSYTLPLLSSDDIDVTNAALMTSITENDKRVYQWGEYYYTSDQTDANWINLYKQIYTANEVLAGVLSSQKGSETSKKTIYAEALMQRAYSYLILMNLYSPVYQPGKGDEIPGVPMLLSPDLYAKLNRPSANSVYNQIISDVREALPSLAVIPDNNFHPGKTAAYALLARTYLYMQQYDSAGVNAQKALDRQNTLLDLRTLTTSTLPKNLQDPEIIFSKTATTSYTLSLNPQLLSLFATSDLRYSLYTRDGGALYPAFTGRAFYRNKWTGESVNVGPSVSEMMLIKAECLVRANKYNEGVQVVNDLRKYRFKSADYTPLTASSATAALKIVLDERRREMMGRGTRWFDQRRLCNDAGLMPSVVRVVNGVTYTLDPMSNRYTYPVAQKILDLNPEIGQVPR